jgi:hypothetical protein
MAKREAVRQKKDILVLFAGSDWSDLCMRLAEAVFLRPQFRTWAQSRFVLLFIDDPREGPARDKVRDVMRNAALRVDYQVDDYPTVVLADAQGRPYAWESYVEPADLQGRPPARAAAAAADPQSYLSHLDKLREQGDRLRRLLDAARLKKGAERLPAVAEAVGCLFDLDLVRFREQYGPLLEEGLKLARDQDARNDKGYYERCFEAEWLSRLWEASLGELPDLIGLVADLDEWNRTCRFRDPNRAARLHLFAARVLALTGDLDEALRRLEEARKCQPTDRELRELLDSGRRALGFGIAGTGFVVGDGLLLTCRHVVKGSRTVLVQLPQVERPGVAHVVADDVDHDVALLQFESPQGVRLSPLPVAGNHVPQRGEEVGAWGYTLGEPGIKYTGGRVSATPEPGTSGKLLLNLTVNPGNSGSPLVNEFGQVVGMITAKTPARGPVDSTGIALPAPAPWKGFCGGRLKDTGRRLPPLPR